jgi:hypothetical protein
MEPVLHQTALYPFAGHRWLKPVILGTQEMDHPGQIVHKSWSKKKLSQKRAGGVAHGEGPEFNPQYCKKRTKKESELCDFHYQSVNSFYLLLSSFALLPPLNPRKDSLQVLESSH